MFMFTVIAYDPTDRTALTVIGPFEDHWTADIALRVLRDRDVHEMFEYEVQATTPPSAFIEDVLDYQHDHTPEEVNDPPPDDDGER